MKQLIHTFLFLFLFFESQAQFFAYKKIAQRRDDFVNNTWKGKDSFLYTYNVDTTLTGMQALQFGANNSWDNWFKYTYTLNGQGKVTIQLRENWTGGNWTNNTRYSYAYDSAGNNTQILYDVWNGNSWTLTGKIEYTGHNAYGKYQTETVYALTGGILALQTKHDRTYVNNQTLVASDEKFVWSGPANNWMKTERLSYTYTQNEVSSIIRLLPDSAAVWVPKDKYIYNYNLAPFHLNEYLVQKYDSILLNWQSQSRITYTYNANSLLDKTQNESFQNNFWNPTERAQYVYNGNQEKVEYFTEISNGGIWNNNTRSTYAYSNALLNQEDQFAGSGNAWVQSKRLQFNYDANQNMIFESKDDCSGGIFTPLSRAFYYYNAYPLSLQNHISNITDLQLYPNPVSDELHIQFDTDKNTQVQIRVLDIFGKTHLIVSQPVFKYRNVIRIPCSTLSNGIYLAQIIDLQESTQQTEKFQIQK